MQTFTIGWGRNWLVRLLGRSPLVRRSDRIEALAALLAALIVVMATPLVGAVGTQIHDSRTQQYAEQARQRQLVTATAVEDSKPVNARPNNLMHQARFEFHAGGLQRVATFRLRDAVEAGERVELWVDHEGRQVTPPPPPSRADTDAVLVAVLLWAMVATGAVGLVHLVRAVLDRRRFADWDRELKSLAGGGHASYQ